MGVSADIQIGCDGRTGVTEPGRAGAVAADDLTLGVLRALELVGTYIRCGEPTVSVWRI